MRSVTYDLRLDVRRSGSQASIRMRQGEQKARRIVAALTDGGKPLGYEYLDAAILRAVKPDGTVLLDDCELTGSIVEYEIPEQLAAVEGLISQLEQGGMSIETSLKRYEEGMQMIAAMEKELAEATQRLTVLRKGAEGVEEIPLEEDV